MTKLIATANRVSALLAPPPTGHGSEKARQQYDADWAAINARDTDADLAVAQAAMEWICSVDARGNDYLLNLKSLVLKAEWTAKDFGLGASLISAYQREQGKIAEREAQEQGPKVAVPTGRMVVEGKVIAEGTKENDFGVRYVMTVLDDRGFKVWGTQPSSIASDIKMGDRVRFTARLEASDRDETFGFFSRPSKAEILVDPAAAESCDHIAWDAYSMVETQGEGNDMVLVPTTCRECRTNLSVEQVRAAVAAHGLVILRGYVGAKVVETLPEDARAL